MKKIIFSLTLAVFIISNAYAQKAMTFEYAANHGNSYQHLDSLYKSAVHTNKDLAVFKTKEEEANLQKAYVVFIQSLGSYLKANNFKWGKPVKCFNRIYFKADGTIDYFLYNIPKDQIAIEKEKEFDRLLNKFAEKERFTLTANEKFAQCSPVKYDD